MSCKYLSRKLCGKFRCKFLKTDIDLHNCNNCSYFAFKINNPIKNKSSKLAKLERERDKNIIKIGKCEYCKKFSNRLEAHEIYGGSNRKRSINYGFVVLLCKECHQNNDIILELRRKCQHEFEINHTREEFLEIIGKSYL